MSAARTHLANAAREAVDFALNRVRLHEWTAGMQGKVETDESRDAVEQLRARITELWSLATLADDEVEVDGAPVEREQVTTPREVAS